MEVKKKLIPKCRAPPTAMMDGDGNFTSSNRKFSIGDFFKKATKQTNEEGTKPFKRN